MPKKLALPDPSHVKTVYLVFKTHLDLGFTDLAANVWKRYRDQFFPAALKLAADLRARSDATRFSWTTGSWLVWRYLEEAPPAQRRLAEQAIERHELCWHALPFTLHSELLDESLFDCALQISGKLDKRFGTHTTWAKMTDVPCHTRGIIAPLVRANVRFLHIGTNPVSPAPKVPGLFLWRNAAGQEIAVGYTAGGYGGDTVSPDGTSVLRFCHAGDNHGPQSANAVAETTARVQADYPQATIVIGDTNHFAATVWKQRAGLPVVTGELGDTWIHGAGTDPVKMSRFRDLMRWRSELLAREPRQAQALAEFSNALLCVAEHTWGLDTKALMMTSPNAYRAFAQGPFHRHKSAGAFASWEKSWAEQRQYLDTALQSLPTPLRREARRAVQPRCARAWKSIARTESSLSLGAWSVGIDMHGAVSILDAPAHARALVDPAGRMGEIIYQVFDAADYERFYRSYNINRVKWASWARPDFLKPGLENVKGHRACVWHLHRTGIAVAEDSAAHYLRLTVAAPAGAVTRYGCPPECILLWRFPCDNSPIDLELSWSDKQACRIPEALWMSFAPIAAAPKSWRMLKIGEMVSPLDVVSKGNRGLHAVHALVHPRLRITPLDTPLVAPGEPGLVRFPDRQPDLRKGWYFNLCNNVWGTNFPMWCEGPARLRWQIVVTGSAARSPWGTAAR